jgi:hypothetical protein
MTPNETSPLILAWLVALLASPLAYSKSPYVGNQGSGTRSTTVPNTPPVSPVPQGVKSAPVQNPFKGNVETTGNKK